ncbi:phage head closure protein [Sulfitobacter dubius]|uniref:phage head closure protein n=1 Tax=Sulfitobacter dubius TaxID=218673 RepID=UPI0008EA318A|nr:phage head closure protein [Sulfitobacter dubius]SFG28057.1 phage head-tail adaptor, putative, SPP1 family [Sulfitobacter dubius]
MSRPHLNRMLVLEVPQRANDGAGGYTEVWQPLGTLWAEVRARTGRETVKGGLAISRTGFKITVRAAPIGSVERPTAEQRFRDGTRIFVIRAVADHDVGGRYLTCFADEEVVV